MTTLHKPWQRKAQVLASAYACWELARELGLTGEPLRINAENMNRAQKAVGVFMVDQVSLDRAMKGELPAGWKSWPQAELAARFKRLLEHGLTQDDALVALHDHGDKYPEAAADVNTNDELEVDEKPLFSRADEGTWVSAWVWVPDPVTDEEGEA